MDVFLAEITSRKIASRYLGQDYSGLAQLTDAPVADWWINFLSWLAPSSEMQAIE